MSDVQLFQRACTIVVDTLQVDGLRCVFKATKTLLKQPNTLDLKIHNLSENSRGQMKTKGSKVTLSAGYVGSLAVIFSGTSRTVDHLHEGTEWVTHIQCGDGAIGFTTGKFGQSYPPGTPLSKIATDAAGALGINPGNLSVKLSGAAQTALKGFTDKSPPGEVLDKVLRSLGLSFSIQDGAVQVLAPGSFLATSAVLLSEQSGLIGSPDHGTPNDKGLPSVLKAKSLLNPMIKVGGKVQLQSDAVSGLFGVQKVEHHGDQAGGEWYTDMELLPTG